MRFFILPEELLFEVALDASEQPFPAITLRSYTAAQSHDQRRENYDYERYIHWVTG